MRRPDACSVEGGRTGHRMVRVIAWSESLHGPSHRLVRVIAWSMVRVIAWSESLHGPSHRMVRVLACSESSSASITRRADSPKLGGRSRAAPPRLRARARVHAHHLGGRPAPKVVGAAPPARHRSATLPTRAKLALSRPRPGADLGPTDQTHHRPPRNARKGRRGAMPPMPVHEFFCCVCDGANRPKGRPEARAGPGPGTGCGGTCAGLGFACGRR